MTPWPPSVGDKFRVPGGREFEVTGVDENYIPPRALLRPPADSGRKDYGAIVAKDEYDAWEAAAKKLN